MHSAIASRPRRRAIVDSRFWFMAAFGFFSGLPLSLSGFTLRQWLTEGGMPLGVLGLTANIGLAYTLKFLWAPLLDQTRAPLGLARLGRRRGWLIAIQPALAGATFLLACSDGSASPVLTVAAAACVALFSATQDIAIDAWRIETFAQSQQGMANAVYVWGYRVAMLVSGAGVIKAADLFGWNGALLGVAALMTLAIPLTLAAPEPRVALAAAASRRIGIARKFSSAVVDPLREFLRRPGAGWILGYVALFKLGEAMAGVMLPPLYRSLGFDRGSVAAAGPYSLVATVVGIGLGGWLIARLGLARALISTGFIQMAAMGLYVWLAGSPGNHVLLYATVSTEAFLQGLADAAFITYLSSLCAAAHTATQFALLTSVAPLASHTVGGLSGFLAPAVGWQGFYAIAMFASLPGMLVMLHILRRYSVPAERVATG